MAKILFFGFPAHGHTNPTLGLIRELRGRGAEIVYYSTPEFQARIEHAGAEFRSYGPEMSSPPKSETRTPIGLLGYLMHASNSFVDRTIPKLRAERPDLIIHDSFAFWGRQIASLLNIPAACSVTTFAFDARMALRSPVDVGRVWTTFLCADAIRTFRRFGATRQYYLRRHGLASPDALAMLSNKEPLNIVYTSRYFQPYSDVLDKSYAFVGPSIAPRGEDTSFGWDRLAGRRVIYISLGTLAAGREAFFRTCFDAFRWFDATVVLSAGRQTEISSLGAVPSNFVIEPYVPQLELLQRADLFITHGGMNSTSEGLYYGVPLLVFPQGGDQYFVGRQVERLGAGLLAQSRRIGPDELRRLAKQVLADPSFRAGAGRIADSFREAGGCRRAADEIMAFAAGPSIAAAR